MNGAVDISVYKLILAYGILLLPIFWLYYYKTGLIKEVIIATIRMAVQLSIVAFYFSYIFTLNNPWVNILWVFIMIIVSVFTTIKRSNLKISLFIFPLFTALSLSLLLIDTFFLGFIINLENVFDARYFIPISGMILGNSMNHNIVGLNAYFDKLKNNNQLYYFILVNKNDHKKAILPYMRDAIKKALNPMIASMSVIGLISLPGMMTGQMLGGSDPTTAVRYQILIMLAIFVSSNLNLVLTLIFSNRFIFDKFGKLKSEI
ncbi:MAG: ABC transporter permease [Methanosarcinales archaeon]|nr:ABC transporter permease [Methanosarcinales archaeon]